MSRGFAPPLRMLAFLSALEHSADKEWDALITAVRSARTKGLEIDFCALVGERALLDLLQGRAREDGDYTVRPMPSPSGIEVMLGEIRPQILHFFCHGREATGTTSVELATLADRAQEAPEPMLLTLDMLKHLPALEELWLVTFNCCQSARGADGLHSLADGLVQEVAPAAVGWREAAAQHSANQFSRSFYADVLGWLATNLRGADPGEAVRIEWAAHLYGARGALRDQYGGELASRDWALPVLYAPYGDLLNVHVYKPGGAQSDQEFRQSLFEAGNLQLAIDALPPDAPAQVRAYLEEQLDAARSAASEASVQ
jgi:hypothetical protein